MAVGTAAGALAGQSVVAALCRPGSCAPLEVTAAVVAGIGALIGTALVTALVTRSFDEYHEAGQATAAAGRGVAAPARLRPRQRAHR